MKDIVKYLKTHIREDFNTTIYIYTAAFLTLFITLNYTIGFERPLVIRNYGTWLGHLNSFLFYAFAYYAIAIPKFIIEKKTEYLKNSEFWIKSIIFIALIGISGSLVEHKKYILSSIQNSSDLYFFIKILNNSTKMFIYVIPLLLVKYFYDKKDKNLYGLTFKGFNWKPYFTMLLIMLPLIIWASFQADFLRTYPTINPNRIYNVFGWNNWILVTIYEFIYGFDFIFVELVFRGALVIGLARIIGKDAILPMVSMYAFLHFGKPLGETLGSIFGGYILGVIALHSKNILGGCVIHIGVALLMEIAAFVQIFLLMN